MGNLSIEVWGPCAWKFLHAITFTYPLQPTDSEREKYKQFFMSIGHVLPCRQCGSHFLNEVHHMDVEKVFVNKESLSSWLVDVHNDVNERNGKRLVPYHVVRKWYSSSKDEVIVPVIITCLSLTIFTFVLSSKRKENVSSGGFSLPSL